MRQSTQCSHDYHRSSIHNNRNQNPGHQSQPKSVSTQPAANAHIEAAPVKINPIELLKLSNTNLEVYQKQELVFYTQVYYYGQNCAKKWHTVAEFTKSDGGYNWLKGDQVQFRYEILDQLGEGSFGEVYKCMDYKRNKLIALKIVKNNEKYANQAKT